MSTLASFYTVRRGLTMRYRLVKPFTKGWVAWLMLCLGLAISVSLGYLMARDLRAEMNLVFQRNVDDVATAIEARLRTYAEVLYGVRGLFAGTDQVTSDQFGGFVTGLDLERRYPGIQAISFYPRVAHGEKRDFEQHARTLGGIYESFAVTPGGVRPEYYPIFYRARLIEGSPLLLGSDQLAEASRRASIELARDSGTVVASSPLANWNGKPSEVGVVMRLPLYRRGEAVATEADRRRAVIGVVGAAFNVRDLIESVARSKGAARLSVKIHDAGHADNGAEREGNLKLLYADADFDLHEPALALLPLSFHPARQAVREIDFGGRQWRIAFVSRTTPALTAFQALPFLIFLGGVVASVLLFALIRSLAQSRQTAERLAESMVAKLTASERRIAETEKFSAVMVIHSDLEGRVFKMPPPFSRLLGYGDTELINRRFHELTLPEDVERSVHARARLISGETRSAEIEKRYLHKDGGIVWAALSMTLVRDEDGRPLHFRSYVRNITARKRAEEELHRLYNELEHRVEQRTADLQTANRELEAFSYSVSHDLRAPVRHIASYARMLQHGAAARLGENDRRYLDRIGAAASRMGRLIDDLLAFSRTSRTEPSLESIDMEEAARRALAELAPETAQRNVKILIAALPAATADAALLHQVWVNLLSNAVKYTAPRAQAVIEVGALAEEGGQTVYFVRDNGVGFDMDHAAKLFGVFQRLHTRMEFEGTGIGLALVHRIVSRHGGRAWAEARIDEGATFYFALPRSKEEQA